MLITFRMQQWRNQFVHLALIWMDVLAKQINQWILLAIREDQVSRIWRQEIIANSFSISLAPPPLVDYSYICWYYSLISLSFY